MQQLPQARIGVIGGSGLYDMEGMSEIQEVNIDTPFGTPSDSITTGKLDGVGIAFLPRHGRGHRFSPTEVPYRANIYALKALGVRWIIGINSVGSFREDIMPGSLLIPDQLIDRTRGRASSFFNGGIVAHIPFADPFCTELNHILYMAAREAGADVRLNGTYVVMEGPAFSTRAESRLYQAWGADVIGMTALPEAKLAREAEICYSIIAAVTDYDCWMERSEPVTVEVILTCMRQNTDAARKIIRLAVKRIPERPSCDCVQALKTAIVTDPKVIPPVLKRKLGLLISKYIPEE